MAVVLAIAIGEVIELALAGATAAALLALMSKIKSTRMPAAQQKAFLEAVEDEDDDDDGCKHDFTTNLPRVIKALGLDPKEVGNYLHDEVKGPNGLPPKYDVVICVLCGKIWKQNGETLGNLHESKGYFK